MKKNNTIKFNAKAFTLLLIACCLFLYSNTSIFFNTNTNCSKHISSATSNALVDLIADTDVEEEDSDNFLLKDYSKFSTPIDEKYNTLTFSILASITLPASVSPCLFSETPLFLLNSRILI